MPVVVRMCQPDRENTILQGIAVNASLEGTRLRLPTGLLEGSLISVSFEGSPSRLGSVCWALAQSESEILHGVRFQVLLERHGLHSRPLRRLRWRQLIRRGLIALTGLAVIAIAAYGFIWWVDQFRAYYPKYYEPKDIERQRYEQQRRLEESKGPSQP